MTVGKTDVTAFFERSASELKISPTRLAALVNAFDTMPIRAWDSVSGIEHVEMEDIAQLRLQLYQYLANAKNH